MNNKTTRNNTCIKSATNVGTFEAPTIALDNMFEKLAKTHAFKLQNYTTHQYELCAACISISSRKMTITQTKG
jgi:hypothetical protein